MRKKLVALLLSMTVVISCTSAVAFAARQPILPTNWEDKVVESEDGVRTVEVIRSDHESAIYILNLKAVNRYGLDCWLEKDFEKTCMMSPKLTSGAPQKQTVARFTETFSDTGSNELRAAMNVVVTGTWSPTGGDAQLSDVEVNFGGTYASQFSSQVSMNGDRATVTIYYNNMELDSSYFKIYSDGAIEDAVTPY